MNAPNPDNTPVPSQGLIFSEALYKKLKFLALVLLPAVNAFYATMGNIWKWPNVEEVIASIAAVDTLLGVLIGISTAAYNKSSDRFVGLIKTSFQDTEVEGMLPTKVFTLDFGDKDPVPILESQKEVTFKVVPPQ